MNLNVVKSRLVSLENSNKSNRSDKMWKPTPGKQVIRILPYAFNPENPFIELKFHYNMNGKTYLSPDSFNRPDPIVEFSNKMKKTGDKEEWKIGKKLEPKMRTYTPILVRGKEDEGIKFWGFGKQVYQQILGYIADPDFGDITDLVSGHDVVVEFKTAEETGKSFPETAIRMKPNKTPACDPQRKDLIEKIKNQVNILDLFPELSYAELTEVMNAWLHPEESEQAVESGTVEAEDEGVQSNIRTTTATVTANVVEQAPTQKAPKSPTNETSKVGKADLEDAFTDLFGDKKK